MAAAIPPQAAAVSAGAASAGARSVRDGLSAATGGEAERFGMGPAIVLGQDLAEVAWPVRDGAVADLATRDRKMGDGHRKTAGT